MSSTASGSEGSGPTSWLRVVVATVLCFVLGTVFSGMLTFETYSVNVFTQMLGFLVAVWISWRVAHEKVIWAVLPTAVIWLLLLAVTFEGMKDGGLHIRSWLTVAGFIVASLVFAWWLGRRARRQQSIPAER